MLGLVTLPVAWRLLDSSLAAVLGGMLIVLTAASTRYTPSHSTASG